MSRAQRHSAGVSEDRESIRLWLDAFAEAVREVDYERGRAMFVEDAVGFGTVGAVLVGIDALVDEQWRRVWGVTERFAFDSERVVSGSEGDLGWAAAPWSSWGRRSADGSRFRRTGRATFVLRRDEGGGGWRAVHSHVSLDPRGVPPDRA